MDEYEQKLKRTRLVAPSETLDRRIEDAFAAARRRRKGTQNSNIWWWLVALATIGSVTAVVIISPRRSLPTAEVTVYRVEVPVHLREILLNQATSSEPAPQFVVHEATTP